MRRSAALPPATRPVMILRPGEVRVEAGQVTRDLQANIRDMDANASAVLPRILGSAELNTLGQG
jgi:hypothetical protein